MSTRKSLHVSTGLLLLAAGGFLAPGAAQLPGAPLDKDGGSVQGLRCEYLADPAGIDVEKPRLSWRLSPASGIRAQGAYRVLVASSLDGLRKDQGDLWDSGRVSSADSTWVPYAGKMLRSGQRVYWKVRVWSDAGKASSWSGPATWSMGLLQASDWRAKWIGERRPSGTAEGTPLPFPWLRKTFTLPAKPSRAVAYVNPLGYYELYINGKKVDDHVLSPAVSDYSKRNLYVTHEVADYLVPGKNVVALWLGRGWYVKGHPGVIHDGPLVRAQLNITNADGGVTEVVTDETWKVRESHLAPLGRGTAFGDYGGERWDAALDLPGWNAPGLDDAAWQTAAVFEPPPAITAAQMVEPNRIVETIHSVGVEAYPQGGWVIDMGKNFVGWLELRLPALAKGTTVKLEYSDQMEPDKPAPGSSTPRPAQGAVKPPAGAAAPKPGRGGNPTVFPNTHNQRDEVVSNGEPITFRSRFNYHGFRYVRVLGTGAAPAVGDATGFFIRTAYDRAGEFTSSDELLNQIHQMITRTYEALTLGGYVVDCPTRERLGYGGDAGTSFETGMLNFSTGGLYNRWLANWRDAQAPSGSLPHTAPNYQNQGGGGPMWGGMVVTLPWQMYLQYGDRRALEANFPMMKQWLAYLASETTDDLLLDHKSHAMGMQAWNFLGDWLTPKGSLRGTVPPVQAINSVHYLYQLQTAAKIAKVLGETAEASAFDARAAAVAKAIHARFYNAADYTYTNGHSIQEAFPLLTGVVPPELREHVMAKVEQVIRVQNGGHLDTGMHGTYFLMKYLLEVDRNDLIYEMVSKRDYPGWGYMLANGATTVWEGWTGQSHIHDTLISIGAWFTQGLAGIRTDGVTPGFKHFVVKPAVVGGLTFVKGKYRSIHGDIASDWRVEKGTFKLTVSVPPGTTATVIVPGEGSIRTKARPSARSAGGPRSFDVAPGTHSFETVLHPKGKQP
ncbi:MAG: family 78 glycoside hydrolase catalytic domain [Acidobacteria bacterium]|nr:family 78 glycoside hydrolase catalytic domain [Acidobacteriota bacterium]